MPYRSSKFIDFDHGVVKIAPMDLKGSFSGALTDDQKLELFECRVDVWTLGVAVKMLKEIEEAKADEIWQHGAYALLSVCANYFEMLGKTLNPNARQSGTASEDFNFGFCDVYPSFRPASGDYRDKIPVHMSPALPNPDAGLQQAIGFRDRLRNGLYHLGYTKSQLWIHNDAGCPDFEVRSEPDNSTPPVMVDNYRVNPHQLTRTIVDHFPRFIARVKADSALMKKFTWYFDQTFSA